MTPSVREYDILRTAEGQEEEITTNGKKLDSESQPKYK